MNKVDLYLDKIYIEENIDYINEFDVQNLVKKLSPGEKIIKPVLLKIQSSIDDNPETLFKKVKSALSFLPSVSPETIDKYFSSKSTDYKKMKSMAETILNNSIPGISKNSLNVASMFLSVSSFIKKPNETKNQKDILKTNMKTFVHKVRKFIDEHEESGSNDSATKLSKEDLPDIAIAVIIITMAITIGIGATFGLITLFGALPSLIALMLVLMAVTGIINYGKK